MSKDEVNVFSLRLSKRLYKRCQELAKEKGLSMNEFIVQTLNQFGDDLPQDAEARLTLRIERLEKAVFGEKKD